MYKMFIRFLLTEILHLLKEKLHENICAFCLYFF